MIAKEYVIGIYRERSKTFMEEPYFYYDFKMVESATKNRTSNLPRNQDSKPKYFCISKSVCPKIMKLHQKVDNSTTSNFGSINFC